MHPQQVVRLRKYRHEQCTEEVCGEGEEESKDEEGKRCGGEGEEESGDESRTTVVYVWVVLRMCMFGVGGEDGDGDEGGGEGE